MISNINININKHILKYLNYQYPLKNGYVLIGEFNINDIKNELNQIFDSQFDIFNDWLYKVFPNKIIKLKDFNDYWWESTYDENGNILTYKNSDGYWWEKTFDNNGNALTFKNSTGNED